MGRRRYKKRGAFCMEKNIYINAKLLANENEGIMSATSSLMIPEYSPRPTVNINFYEFLLNDYYYFTNKIVNYLSKFKNYRKSRTFWDSLKDFPKASYCIVFYNLLVFLKKMLNLLKNSKSTKQSVLLNFLNVALIKLNLIGTYTW